MKSSGLVSTFVIFALAAQAAEPQAGNVTLKVIKWPELEKTIASHKGKVVVMDVWADFCIPCKREFPHLVELHHKYAKDGLVCISLTVDDKDDKDKSLTFLKKQKATFGNYLIDEEAELWQKRLDVSAPPGILVYDRSGKKVKTFTSENPFTYADVEKLIVPLLKEKK